MPTAELAVDLPAETWMGRLSTERPDARFEVTSLLPGAETSVAVVEASVADPAGVVAAAEAADQVAAVDLLWAVDDRVLLQVESRTHAPVAPAIDAGVPLETPFAVRDGVATWTVQTTTAALSRLGDALEAAALPYDLRYVADTDAPARHDLTERQAAVLEAAVDAGYYRIPRETTLTELAADLAVSKATASDVLRRAEAHVVEEYVATTLDGDD